MSVAKRANLAPQSVGTNQGVSSELTDEYKKFFENYVFELGNKYYCYPCDKVFADSSTSFVHIEEDSHQLNIALQPKIETSFLPNTEISYKFLVTNSIVMFGASVRCLLCDCKDFGNKNILQHVNGLWHKNCKSEFTRRIDTQVVKDSQAEKSKLEETGQSQGANNLEQKEYYSYGLCVICNIKINSCSVEGHFNNETHKNLLKQFSCDKISLKKDNFYHCSLCDCKLSRGDVSNHIRGKRHASFLKDSKTEKAQNFNDTLVEQQSLKPSESQSKLNTFQNKTEIVLNKPVVPPSEKTTDAASIIKQSGHVCDSTCKNSPCIYFELSRNDFYCKICYRVFALNEYDVHVAEKRHSDAIDRLNDNKIILTERNDCYCDYCKCIVSGLENIPLHVKGYLHSYFRNKLEKESKELESSVTNESSVKKSSMLAANERLVKEKISPIEGNDYNCGYCECKIPGIENVYRHIQGNRHKDSKSKINVVRSEPEVPTSNKIAVKVETEITAIEDIVVKAEPEPSTSNKPPIEIVLKAGMSSNIPVKVDSNTEAMNASTPKRYENSLQLLTSNKISLLEGTDYNCEYCSCTISGIDNIFGHVQGKRHRSSRSKVKDGPSLPGDKQALKSKPEQTTCKNTPSKVASSNISDKVEPNEEATSNNILNKDEPNKETTIKIIDKVGPNNEVTTTPTQKYHENTLELLNTHKISLFESNVYNCEYCDCNIPGFDNVLLHIKGKRHSTSQSKIQDGSSLLKVTANNEIVVKIKAANKDPAVKVKPAVSLNNSLAEVELKKQAKDTEPVCFIVELSASSFFCKICDIHFNNKKNIDDHVKGKCHANALKKYGCDAISFKAGITYYCSICECKLLGLATVCTHVKGNMHMDSLRESSKAATPKLQKWDSLIASLSANFKNLTEPKVVESQKKRKPRSKRQRVRNLFSDLEADKKEINIQCTICNQTVTNTVMLHTHLAKHFSASFISIDDHKRSNEKITVNNSQTALHSNGRLINTGLAMDGEKIFAKREEKKINMKKVMRSLNFEKDCIYSMKDRLTEFELGMKLCFPIDSDNIYCLICQKNVSNTMQNYFHHLYSLDHCEYLDKMEKDHELFKDYPDQFSALNLALEYMEEIAEDTVRCLVCKREFDNVDHVLREHIDGKKHKNKYKEMHAKATDNFAVVKSRIHCSWYEVQRYWCVLCFKTYASEVGFVKHLDSKDHAFVMKIRENSKRKMIFDFCESCALLWYGYRCTYAYHCDIATHQWLVQDGHYLSSELPDSMKMLLASPEEYVEDKIKYYDHVSLEEREKEKTLIQDMQNAVKSKFPNGKAYTFGSRVSGLGSPDSDIDVFLDCGNMYNGKTSSTDKIQKFMITVHECLSKESKSWDVDELLTTCRSPIIKAHHRVTGLSCDISFENGLAVENTKLIKSFNDTYPACRKMILFLKQWLTYGKLSGSQAITSYALSWFVIFYLQNELILPSISSLTMTRNTKSHTIAGWQVGVDLDFTYNHTESNFSIKELLTRFFTFYANFDFRYDVACPLLGETIKKREFADPENLPAEMATYIAYMENSENPVPFRIDSVMCIQDPFDLQHNLTKAVSKVNLNRFRTYCSKSLEILC